MLDDAAASMGPILARHGIGLAVIFGSRARGTGREGSDLDLGVEHASGRPLGLIALGRLRDELAPSSPAEIDIVDLASADCLVRFEIARDGHACFEDVPGRWTAFVSRTLIDHDDIAHFLPALVAGVGRAARRGGPQS